MHRICKRNIEGCEEGETGKGERARHARSTGRQSLLSCVLRARGGRHASRVGGQRSLSAVLRSSHATKACVCLYIRCQSACRCCLFVCCARVAARHMRTCVPPPSQASGLCFLLRLRFRGAMASQYDIVVPAALAPRLPRLLGDIQEVLQQLGYKAALTVEVILITHV